MNFANDWPQGCQSQLSPCAALDRSTLRGTQACSSATFACRNNVEYPWYSCSGLGTYDVRVNATADDPPTFFIDYLNQASIQEALGVDTNYTSTSNNDVYNAFQQPGDFVSPNFLEDLEWLLEQPVPLASDASSRPATRSPTTSRIRVYSCPTAPSTAGTWRLALSRSTTPTLTRASNTARSGMGRVIMCRRMRGEVEAAQEMACRSP